MRTRQTRKYRVIIAGWVEKNGEIGLNQVSSFVQSAPNETIARHEARTQFKASYPFLPETGIVRSERILER